jgi:hypothetical protein
MRTDGAIQVKHGDWLSKYSAALYNDFTHIHEFGRKDRSGKIRPIHNVNRIFTGEIIYHIPTYKTAHPMRMDAIAITASPLSDEQKRRVIVETLEADYHLKGDQLEVLEEAAHITHGVDSAVEIGEIAGLIAEEGALAAGASILAVASGFLTAIGFMIAILNASETDMKLAGMQAIGYALTAWAFGDPIPAFPSSLKTNFAVFPGRQALPRVEQAWAEASQATVNHLEAQVVKKGVKKRSYQIFWQALGSGDQKKLVRLLMDARAEELRGPQRQSFLALDPDGYPN